MNSATADETSILFTAEDIAQTDHTQSLPGSKGKTRIRIWQLDNPARLLEFRRTDDQKGHLWNAIIDGCMREIHGVVEPSFGTPGLKRYALMFDHFQVLSLTPGLTDPAVQADVSFLESKRMAHVVPHDVMRSAFEEAPFTREEAQIMKERLLQRSSHEQTVSQFHINMREMNDLHLRRACTHLSNHFGIEAIPIVQRALPEPLPDSFNPAITVLSVGVTALPVPGQDAAWEDVLEFKAEARDQQWELRRFLHALATKSKTEAEIRDEIEYAIRQYEREMDRLKMKRTVTFVETYIIPTVEALESFKPSSILKALVSIKKRKIELLEAEMKAPGRECAYVFDARKRFGS